MNSQHLTLCIMLLTLVFPLSSAELFDTKKFQALYVFGDSLVDCGNNNHLRGGKANYLPYGIDFLSGNHPTGRATNGKTVADFLATHLGLPFVPAFLDLSNDQRNNISTGINYASGGSGIMPDTNNDTSFTFDEQIMLFNTTVEQNLPKIFDEKEKLDKHLSESLFFVSTGVNDNFRNGTFRGNIIFATFLLNEFSQRIQRIYHLGARNFLVNNLPPAGCFPSKAIKTTPIGNCDENINNGISFYNKRLPEVLNDLQSKLLGFKFVHADLFGFLKQMRETGNNYGIVDTWKPCCPNTINGDLKCRPNTIPCPNRDTHLFWDDLPTQIVNKIYARLCFDEGTICKSSGL